MKTLITYEDIHGFNTIDSIIYHWAPPSENNTGAYINEVSRRTGIPHSVLIDVKNIDVLIALAKAITMKENGIPPDNMPQIGTQKRHFTKPQL